MPHKKLSPRAADPDRIDHPSNLPTFRDDAHHHQKICSIANEYLRGGTLIFRSTLRTNPEWWPSWGKQIQEQQTKRRKLSKKSPNASTPKSALDPRSVTHHREEHRIPIAKGSSTRASERDSTISRIPADSTADARTAITEGAHSSSADEPLITIGGRRQIQDKHEDTSYKSKRVSFSDTPAFERRSKRDRVKPSLKKTCAWCGTSQSYQWRKGPAGPATLCSSCGTKWTNQQKKAQKDKAAFTLAHDDVNADKPIQPHPISLAKPPSVPPSQPTVSDRAFVSNEPMHTHEQICQRMFPDGEMRDAVMRDQATQLEYLNAPEVLNLRGKPCPSTRTWDKTPSKQVPRLESFNEVLKASKSSPRKRHSDRDDSDQDPTLQGDRLSRVQAKRRKVTTFDTPRPLQGPISRPKIAQVDGTIDRKSSAEEKDGVRPGIASAEDVGANDRAAYTFRTVAKETPNNNKTPIRDADWSKLGQSYPHQEHQQLVSRRHSTVSHLPEISTQAALLQAQEAFQDNLASMPDGETSELTGYLKTPSTHDSPHRTPGRMQQLSSIAPLCTQELFDQTIDFGSPSPTGRSMGVNQLSNLSHRSEKDKSSGNARLHEKDLPTSPAISQAGIEGATGGVDHNDCASLLDTPTKSSLRWRQHTPSSVTGRSSPPTFSSTARLMHQMPMAQDPEPLDSWTEGIDVDEVIAEAGSFLNTWRT